MVVRALITGASGFVGSAVCAEAIRQGWEVSAGTRKPANKHDSINWKLIGPIDGTTDWAEALEGIDVVIHLAARVHVMEDSASDPLAEFRKVNVLGTERLALEAAGMGVKRFVYISSIGVNGALTQELPFTEHDIANPSSYYATSKWEAELALQRIAKETGMEVVILRPPLIYGGKAPGNWAKMLKVISHRIPLPVASVNNKRSFIYVDNLVDVVIKCATHPAAAGQTYLVSDGEDISTPELCRILGEGMNCSAHLFRCPTMILKFAGAMVGQSEQVARLLGSLQVDSNKIRRELEWSPPYTLKQGLEITARLYKKCHL